MINKKVFEEILADSSLLNDEKKDLLKQLVADFPFCQTFQILYLKSLQLNNDIYFDKRLGFAATYAANREALKYYLHPEENIIEYQQDIDLEEKDTTISSVEGTDVIKEKKITSETILSSDKDKKVVDTPKIETPKDSIVDRLEELKWLKEELSTLKSENERIKSLLKNEQEITGKKKIESSTKTTKDIAEQDISDEKSEDNTIIINDCTKVDTEKSNSFEDENPSIEASSIKSNSNNEKDIVIEENEIKIADNTSTKIAEDEIKRSDTELIESFIENQPSITKGNVDFFDPSEAAKKSLEFNTGIISETLAKIHLKQGNISEAIKIYQQLSLKYPEKSSYFANQIKNIK